MAKKLFIDLLKLRELGECKLEAIDQPLLVDGSFKTIRELATFQFTCRRCHDAPCIEVCPVDALEKDEQHMVTRSVNLCIRCKSCIASCPFGTMSLDLFQNKSKGYQYFDISNEKELVSFAEAFPDDVIRITDEEAAPEEQVYQLSERVLIKDFAWKPLE